MTRWVRAGVLLITAVAAQQRDPGKSGEWAFYGGDVRATKYSPLDQINADNVKELRIAWRHPAVPLDIANAYPEVVAELPGREKNLLNDESRNNFESTPLMVNGVLYAVNGIGLVEALDPITGKTLWMQEPFVPGLEGYADRRKVRGLSYWRDGDDERTFSVRGRYLFSLNATTGKPVPEFGDNGKVDLTVGFRLPVRGYSWSGFPLVAKDVVIVAGNGTTSAGRGAAPVGHDSTSPAPNPTITPRMLGDIRAYDVRTGKLRWTFHTIPSPGEFGNDTWLQGSWERSGGADSWAVMTADPDLGYVYVPLDAPEYDWYGGVWPGNNLFADTLVCLDARTGKRVWHYQLVHHNLWDYETPTAPILADLKVDGRTVRAVIQTTKMGFTFVLDRVTGAPVWPIEERPVPQGHVPGEWYSPTQPFPTRPAPFDRQGVTLDDLIDFTPELHAEAVAIAKQYVFGPIYTPPSIKSDQPGGTKGTLMVPSWIGGNNWDGAAFDPETHLLYVPSMTSVFLAALKEADRAGKYAYQIDGTPDLLGPQGLPLIKPPYGRLTAIDMDRGEHVWMVPIGDGPRNHPLLKSLSLPPLGTPGRRAPLLTKTLLFLGEGDPTAVRIPKGGGGNKFRAFEKATGKLVWETELPVGTTGAPMTYSANGTQYIVVAIGGLGHPAEFVAFSRPPKGQSSAAPQAAR
jgi:quinoprotein glucose dehydrogenase